MNWINDFLHETKEAETPEIWLRWSAIATIAAVASPNLALDIKGLYKLKPNIYVILIGRSGLGKAFGITTSRKLVSMVNNTRVISGRSTIEATLVDLATATTSENGAAPFKDARGYLCSGEFAASIHRNNDALTILTDLYDTKDNEVWKNRTKTGGIETLNKPCLTMLTGANPDMFDLAVEKAHIQGGFVGRTFLIAADKRSKIDAHVDEADEAIDYEGLSRHLCKISKLSGEFKWGTGKEFFREWYTNFADKDVLESTGTGDRLKDNVKKVAMCMSLAKRTDLIIQLDDVEDALEYCGELVRTAVRMTTGQGNSQTAKFIRPVLDILGTDSSWTMTRKKLLLRGVGQFNSGELDLTIRYLMESGMIELTSVNRELAYQATTIITTTWGKITNDRSRR